MQIFFATAYVPRHRAETRLAVFLPPSHSGLGGLRGLMLPTYARLTARRTYSLRIAQFWDAYASAINCRNLSNAQICLTMAKLASTSRGTVPKGTSNHLPAEASLFPAKASGSQCPQHRISPGHRTCDQDAFWAATKRETNQKGFKLGVGLHHPTEPHKGNSCPWAELSRNAQIVHRTTIVATIIIVPGPQLWYHNRDLVVPFWNNPRT